MGKVYNLCVYSVIRNLRKVLRTKYKSSAVDIDSSYATLEHQVFIRVSVDDEIYFYPVDIKRKPIDETIKIATEIICWQKPSKGVRKARCES